jgi:flagellar biosynthetic protein FliR
MSIDGFILVSFVFARVGGLILTAPVFGAREVPLQARLLLAAAITLLLAPSQCCAAAPAFNGPLHYFVLLAIEALIGACLGWGVAILFHAMTVAGELIGHASGLSIAEVLDPGLDENVPVLSRMLYLLALAVFLAIGGHRMVLAGLLDTFQAISPGRGELPGSLAEGITALLGQSFSLGVRAAAPAVTALLVATLVVGLIARTLPQLNVLAMGLGLNAFLALAALGLTVGIASWAFAGQLQPALETLFRTLKTPLRTEWMS